MSSQRLSDTRVRALTEPGRYTDGTVPGLCLQISEAGGKLWRLRYRLNGKENMFAVGAYPAIGLKRAREIAQDARTSIANGIAPLKAKTARKEEQRAKEPTRSARSLKSGW